MQENTRFYSEMMQNKEDNILSNGTKSLHRRKVHEGADIKVPVGLKGLNRVLCGPAEGPHAHTWKG